MIGTRKLAGATALALAAGCAAARPAWVPVSGGTDSPPSGRYSLQFPDGWMLRGEADRVLASRDGIFLQRIEVARREAGKPLGSTKKMLARGMLPQEVAEVVQDAIMSSPGMQGSTMLENAPAEIDGRPWFKLVFGYKDPDGLKIRAVLYGVLVEDSLYELAYQAPERHYFGRDLAAFEQVRASFKVRAPVAVRASGAE
jgi:hypothetical protein